MGRRIWNRMRRQSFGTSRSPTTTRRPAGRWTTTPTAKPACNRCGPLLTSKRRSSSAAMAIRWRALRLATDMWEASLMHLPGSRRSFKGARGTAVLIAAGALFLCHVTAVEAAGDYPVVYDLPAGVAVGETVRPTPLGANDWTCRPTAGHPRPVVLVPGLRGDPGWDFQAAAPLLANNGYCVFAFDFKTQGRDAIENVAPGLSQFVDRVLAATGAGKVDLLSHSEGGVVARYYLEVLGGADKVGVFAAISPLSPRTTLAGVATLPRGDTTAAS